MKTVMLEKRKAFDVKAVGAHMTSQLSACRVLFQADVRENL
jgi:hypothetical protein